MRAFPGVAAAGLLVAALLGAAAAAGPGDAKPTYVGLKKGQCAKCHFNVVKAWKETHLAKSLETLKPVTEKEDKARFDKLKGAGLDPSKDYSTDPKCLKCHTTGYGKEGGYPEKTAEADKALLEAMGAVSCEVCHGPASGWAAFKNEERKKDPARVFTKEELAKAGLVPPTAETCRACHNETAPIKPDVPFDFEKMKARVHPHEAKK